MKQLPTLNYTEPKQTKPTEPYQPTQFNPTQPNPTFMFLRLWEGQVPNEYGRTMVTGSAQHLPTWAFSITQAPLSSATWAHVHLQMTQAPVPYMTWFPCVLLTTSIPNIWKNTQHSHVFFSHSLLVHLHNEVRAYLQSTAFEVIIGGLF